ncbi:unnamed protein product [Ectocarpus sp. 12 AP-2014]
MFIFSLVLALFRRLYLFHVQDCSPPEKEWVFCSGGGREAGCHLGHGLLDSLTTSAAATRTGMRFYSRGKNAGGSKKRRFYCSSRMDVRVNFCLRLILTPLLLLIKDGCASQFLPSLDSCTCSHAT